MRAEDHACVLHQRGLQRLDAGDLHGAQRWFARALELFERAGASARGDVANVLVELARIDRQTSELPRARAGLERALKLLRGHVGREVVRLRVHASSELGVVLIDLGKHATALRVARRAARAAARLPAEDRAVVFNVLGMACKYNGRFDEGLAAYRRALHAVRRAHPGDPSLRAALEHNIGGILHARGDFQRAEPHARRAVDIRARHFGPEHPDVLADEAALAAVLDGLQRWEEAEVIHHRVIAGFSATFGPRHVEVAHTTGNYAAHLQLRGRKGEAARMYRRAIALKRRTLGDCHPGTALERFNLATLELERSRPDRAVKLLSAALPSYVACLGVRHPDTNECRALLAEARRATRKSLRVAMAQACEPRTRGPGPLARSRACSS